MTYTKVFLILALTMGLANAKPAPQGLIRHATKDAISAVTTVSKSLASLGKGLFHLIY